MGKFDGILMCTDLDGTLLNSESKISKENKAAIEYFKSEGGRFTFITGRPPRISEQYYDMIAPNAPYGCINGGGLFDIEKNDYIWTQELSRKALELVRFVDLEMPGIGIQLNTVKNIYFCKDTDAMVWWRDITGMPLVACHYDDIKEPFLKVLFADMNPRNIDLLAEKLSAHPLASEFDFVCSDAHIYEILPKGIGKGVAIEKLCEILGIDRQKTIAVGDYGNDVSMLKTAGVGFAVANACDEAKAAADRITVSNDEHAIAKIIDDLDKGLIF